MTEAEKLIQRWWTEKTWADNLARQQRAQRLIDYYNGDQLDYIELVLDEQFADPKALKLQLGLDNITRMIGDRISRVFDGQPALTCENAAGQRLIDELTADGRLYLTLKIAEVYANLTGCAALHPWFDDRRGKLKTRLFPSSALWVVQAEDDPTEPEALVYSQSLRNNVTGLPTTSYTYWDVDATRRFNTEGISLAPIEPNPYGLLPFAFMRDQIPVDVFFPEIGDELITAQDGLNILLTELNQLIKMQSFSQPVFQGLNDPKSPIVVDPSKPIRMPSVPRDETPPDFKFVTPSAKIEAVMEAIKVHVERICKRYDINLDTQTRGAVISGYALKMTEAGLNRRREDAIPLARQCLFDWWRASVAINNYHRIGAFVPPDAALMIDFAEPKYEEDPAIIAEHDSKRIEQGVMSAVDIIMRDNPDLDEAAAIEKYNKNMSFKQASRQRFGLADLIGPRQRA